MSKLNKAQKNMIKSIKTCGVHVLGEKAIERKVSGSNKLQAARLSAAFYTSKLWPNGTTFNVRFTDLRPDKQVDFTIYDERVLKDSPTEVDPLQKLFWGYDENDKQNITTYQKNKTQIPKWIQKIISERLEPLVNLNFKWHLEEEAENLLDRKGGPHYRRKFPSRRRRQQQLDYALRRFAVHGAIEARGSSLDTPSPM